MSHLFHKCCSNVSLIFTITLFHISQFMLMPILTISYNVLMVKVKVCFYIAHVSSPLDRSKCFVLLILVQSHGINVSLWCTNAYLQMCSYG